MHGNASALLKNTCEMERRRMNGASDLVKRDAFSQPAGEVGLGRLDPVRVIVLCAASTPARRGVPLKRRLQNVGDELETP